MTVSHLNANRTSQSETTQANTTELIPSNITENLGIADGRLRRNLPSNKTESTAISTDPSNKSKKQTFYFWDHNSNPWYLRDSKCNVNTYT